jgi:hypothetical protein
MENRDRDKISKGTGSAPDSDVNRDKSSNFGQKVGRGENMQSDRGRSSGSSDLDDVDRDDLKKHSGYRGGNRGGSGIGSESL